MKDSVFYNLDSAYKLYALGWLYGEHSIDGEFNVDTRHSDYKCVQFVKKILGMYTKSKTIKFKSDVISNHISSLTFDYLASNVYFNAFCVGVLDKYGLLKGSGYKKFVVDNHKSDNFGISVSALIVEHFNMACTKCHEFIVIEGSSIVDSLCPIYFKSDIHIQSPVRKYLNMLIGGDVCIDVMLDKDAIMPTKAHYSDAGLDLSVISEYKQIDEYTSLYDTGVKVSPPIGYWSAIFPRSSISKSGFMVHNSVGVVDVSYRGTLLVALTKVNPDAELKLPFKCAQLILIPQVFASCKQTLTLDNTSRGTGGYGSSG